MSRGTAAYGSSKLANVLFAAELHRREASMHTGVAACSLHPGNMMATDIGRGNWFVNTLMKAGGLFGITRSMAQGAATTVLCTLVGQQSLRGQYWSDCGEAEASWRAVVSPVTLSLDAVALHVTIAIHVTTVRLTVPVCNARDRSER